VQKRAAEESDRQEIIERKALAVEKKAQKASEKAECSLQHSIAQQREEEKIQLAATKKNKILFV
jgi:hypothetical protein